MAHASERLVGAHRSLIETSQNIGIKGLEGATRLFQLHLQTLDSLLGRGASETAGSASAGAAIAVLGSSEASQPLLQPGSRAMAFYTRQAAEIVTSTQGEMARLMQQQALGWQSLGREMLGATTASSVAASETVQAMMRNPVASMHWAVQQWTGSAVAQAGNAAASREQPATAPFTPAV